MAAAGIGERLPVERPEDCGSRAAAAVGTGLVAGAVVGAVTANWGNVPPVLADRPWPALKHTGARQALLGGYANPVPSFSPTLDRRTCQGPTRLFVCAALKECSSMSLACVLLGKSTVHSVIQWVLVLACWPSWPWLKRAVAPQLLGSSEVGWSGAVHAFHCQRLRKEAAMFALVYAEAP